MKIFKSFAFLIVFSLIAKASFSQTQSVCSKDNLPSGWVVTDINTRCIGCCGATGAQWGTSYTITKIDAMPVGSTISVCIKDNLPAGWVVTATNTNCIGCCGAVGSEKGTSYTIKRSS